MNDLEKLRGLGATEEQAQELHAEMQARGLSFSSLLTLLPVFLKLLPKFKELFKEVQDSGVLDVVTK